METGADALLSLASSDGIVPLLEWTPTEPTPQNMEGRHEIQGLRFWRDDWRIGLAPVMAM